MSSAKIAAYVVTTMLVGVLAVQYVRAVSPGVTAEREKVARAACAAVAPPPFAASDALGRFPRMAPDIAGVASDGKTYHLSDLRGKVVFLNFWATWCGTCREEMPAMDQLARSLGPDFVILAVATNDSWDAIHKYFPNGTPMMVVLDNDDEQGGAAAKWGTTKLPETYLIDKEGRIRYYFVSVREWTDPKTVGCLKALIAE
jgi:thiol-disulfide isomerase/thioredoxin